jgi:hypothetical protein
VLAIVQLGMVIASSFGNKEPRENKVLPRDRNTKEERIRE